MYTKIHENIKFVCMTRVHRERARRAPLSVRVSDA